MNNGNRKREKSFERLQDEERGKGNLEQSTVNIVTFVITAVTLVFCFFLVHYLFGNGWWQNCIAGILATVCIFFWLLPRLTIEVPVNQIWVYEDTLWKTVRPVEPGMHAIMFTERKVQPNWFIDLRKDEPISNNPGELYKTADNKWVEIEWTVLIAPSPEFPINALNHDIKETSKIFRQRVTNFLTGYAARHNADDIIGKARDKDTTAPGMESPLSPKFVEFQEAFRNQFSGSDYDDLEVKYGVWTNVPQLGLVRQSEQVRKSDESKSIVRNMLNDARIITGQARYKEDGAIEEIPDAEPQMPFREAMQIVYAVNNPDKIDILQFQNAPAFMQAAPSPRGEDRRRNRRDKRNKNKKEEGGK